MNYKKNYDQLINRIKNRMLKCHTENDHIVHRFMGRSNNKENLVRLTSEEHYKAPSFDVDDIVETIRGSDIQTIPRFPTLNTLIDTATASRYSGPLISGSANEAALSDTIVSSTQENGDT